MPLRPELGRIIWKLLHCLSYRIDINNGEQIERFKKFERSIIYLLPCTICRAHYESILKHDSYKKLGENEIVRAINFSHNRVNKRVKKKFINLEESEIIWEKSYMDSRTLLNILSQITMSFSHFQYNQFWRKNIGVKHGKKYLKNLIIFGLSLIYETDISKTKDNKQSVSYEDIMEIVNGYNLGDMDPKTIYSLLEELKIDFELGESFTHKTDGCSCINK